MRKRIEELGQAWREAQMRQVGHAALRAGLAQLDVEEPIAAEALREFWDAFAAGGRAHPEKAAAGAIPFGVDIHAADWWTLCCLYVAADPQRVVGMRVPTRGTIFDRLEVAFPYTGDDAGSAGGAPTPTPPQAA